MIETRTVLLQGRKKIEQKIVCPARFNAYAISIPHGPGQTDLIHHQLELKHLLIQALGLGNACHAATQQY